MIITQQFHISNHVAVGILIIFNAYPRLKSIAELLRENCCNPMPSTAGKVSLSLSLSLCRLFIALSLCIFMCFCGSLSLPPPPSSLQNFVIGILVLEQCPFPYIVINHSHEFRILGSKYLVRAYLIEDAIFLYFLCFWITTFGLF